MQAHKTAARVPAVLALLTAALLAGCGSSVKLNDAPVESRTPTLTTPGGGSASSAGASESRVATVDLGNGSTDAAAGLARVVYFDFDSFAIKDEFKPVVEGHAKALVANRGRKLVLEGHTDERGGREYNLALGQKRAEAVARSLALLGAADNQVEAVSFGKERPALQGSDEAAWAKNRRVEFKDR
jgi:peptidoglycan-associated lipoprotein